MLRNIVSMGRSYELVPQTILSEMEAILSEVFSDNTAFFANQKSTFPKSNLIELADKYVIEMAVAGLTKADLSISLDGDKLTIEGAKKSKYDKATYHIKELSSRSFKKTITLPSTVNKDKIEANFTDGILEIFIMKMSENDLKGKITQVKIN